MSAAAPVARTLVVGTGRANAYATIGDALSAAADGAVVTVAPGTYLEAIYLNGVSATIVAADGPGTVVVDAGTLPYPALACTGGTVEIRDVTIRAGEAPVVTVDSGRLRLDRCEVAAGSGTGIRVTNGSRVTMSRVKVHGGRTGLVIDDSTGTVEECEISDVDGDGIIVRHGADPVLRACAVRNCGDRGCYVYQYGRPTLEGCTFVDVGDIGIAVVHESAPVIRRCTVARSRGPGLSFGRGCGGSVEACRFEDVGGEEIRLAEGAHPVVAAGDVKSSGAALTVGTDEDRVAALLSELDAMVGLAGVKDEVRTLIDEIQVNEWRQMSGLSVGNLSHHLIFTGAPGTGKTTVARIYGRILSALKVLPKDTFLEVTRQDLVVGYLGQTAAKTTEVFQRALGGVLFIDEAYTLARTVGAGRDFGQEALDTLVKLMEDHREEIAVIAAGYTDEMVEFLAVNPGLTSRFARTVEFANYTVEQLVSITGRMAESADYTLEPATNEVLRRHFATLPRTRTFGNAREARRLFESVRKAQARRLRQLGRRPTLEELRLIRAADLVAAVGS